MDINKQKANETFDAPNMETLRSFPPQAFHAKTDPLTNEGRSWTTRLS